MSPLRVSDVIKKLSPSEITKKQMEQMVETEGVEVKGEAMDISMEDRQPSIKRKEDEVHEGLESDGKNNLEEAHEEAHKYVLFKDFPVE